jgi:hypothetical protein
MWASGSVLTLKCMARVRQASPAQRRHAAAMRRDGALSRLSSITAAIGVAIIAAVGALGIYVGKALPGHHAPSTSGTSTPAGNSGSATGTNGAATGNSGQGALNPPSTPTQGTSLPAPVTSGSS